VNLRILVRLNNWDNVQARREIASSMTGLAKTFTRNIDVGDVVPQGQQVAPFEDLLTAYDGAFVPAAASQMARRTLRSHGQLPDETIAAWHARFRNLFMRAHPNLHGAALEEEPYLSELFCEGLLNPNIRIDTYKSKPANYTEALANANDSWSAYSLMVEAKPAKNIMYVSDPASQVATSEPVKSIAYVPGPSTQDSASTLCWFCSKGGHQRVDCELWAKAKQQLLSSDGGRGGGRRDNNRGGGSRFDRRSNRGGGRGRGGRQKRTFDRRGGRREGGSIRNMGNNDNQEAEEYESGNDNGRGYV